MHQSVSGSEPPHCPPEPELLFFPPLFVFNLRSQDKSNKFSNPASGSTSASSLSMKQLHETQSCRVNAPRKVFSSTGCFFFQQSRISLPSCVMTPCEVETQPSSLTFSLPSPDPPRAVFTSSPPKDFQLDGRCGWTNGAPIPEETSNLTGRV